VSNDVKQKKLSPFDFLNEINSGKRDLMEDDHDGTAEKQYVPFIVNRAMSYHIDTVLFANDMNMYPALDKKLQYRYHLNSVRPRKRFSKWSKPIDSDDLKLVQQAYGYNIRLATETLSLLSKEQLNTIRTKHDEGGVSGGSRK